MSLINPILFAAGVAFVALPIVLHFLRRRRPPVMWGAMRFLVEAYRRRRRRMTIEQLLLLATRCVLVLLVALLVGRPILGGNADSGGPRELVLVIDNSIASGRTTADQTALDRHKDRALALLDGLDPSRGDRAALITLAGPSQAVVFPPSSDVAAVSRLIGRIRPSESRADLAGAFRIAGDGEPAEGDGSITRSLVVLSEWRSGSAQPDLPLPPVPEAVDALLLADPSADVDSNVGVTGVEPLRSLVLGDGPTGGQARVSLVRSGEVAQALVAQIEIRDGLGSVLGTGDVSFAPGDARASGLIGFELPPAGIGGSSAVSANLVTADSIAADDTFTIALERRRAIEAGVVAGRGSMGRTGLERFEPADWIRLALAPGGAGAAGVVRVIDVPPSSLDAAQLQTLDAAVLLEPEAMDAQQWLDMRGFVDRGGLLLVTPAAGDEPQLWTDSFLSAFGLGWTIDRVATMPDAGGLDAASFGREGSLLSLLAGEADSLAAGVSVSRVLGVSTAPGDAAEQTGTRIEATLASGEPLLLSASPVSGRARVEPGTAPGSTPGTPGSPLRRPGLVAMLTVPADLAWTDLPARPVMVPLIQELIREGVGRSQRPVAGIAGMMSAPEGTPLRPAMLGETAGPRGDVRGGEAIRDAGIYTPSGPAGTSLMTLTVNPDADGAQIDLGRREVLGPWLAEAAGGADRVAWIDAEGIAVPDSGSDSGADAARAAGLGGESGSGPASRLIVWLASLALGVAVCEAVLARVASRGSGTGSGVKRGGRGSVVEGVGEAAA
ncbi:MAG: BatA domain-containing protein [Planctomycetota bacterium]